MAVREARLGDFDRVMELYAQLHPSDSRVDDGSDRQVYEEILATPNLHLFVLEDDAYAPAGWFTGDATLVSPSLPGLAIPLASVFRADDV